MRYRLRTLLVVLALGPPLVAIGYWRWLEYRAEQERRAALQDVEEIPYEVLPDPSPYIGKDQIRKRPTPDEN